MSQQVTASTECGASKQDSGAVAGVELLESASVVERVRDYQSIEREPKGGDNDASSSFLCCGRCYRQKGSLCDHLIYFCALSVASYAGVFARTYLSLLAKWNGVPYFPSLYAEVIGTLIMGFITSHKQVLAKRHKAVYQGIATGLCGSITTFSSWNSEAVTTLLQIEAKPVSNATRVIGWITTLLLGFSVPSVALQVGTHLANLSPWCDKRQRVGVEGSADELDTGTSTCCKYIESFVIFITWVLSSAMVVVLPWSFNRHDLLFSAVFASLGTYIRWHLSPLNAAITNFKLGTFIANVSGSWILAAVLVLQTHFTTSTENSLWDGALVGIATGFCGCLTTVSTFMVELSSLSLRGRYLYAVCSVVVAHIGLVAVRGSYIWTR